MDKKRWLPEVPPDWLHWLETCDSTNTWAMANSQLLKPGDVVFTRNQSAGRGQHGRVWHSLPGVLTLTFIAPPIPVAHLAGLSLVSGLAVIDAVEMLLPALSGILQLKWVNDVWLYQRKLAGILCEFMQDKAIIGIGLNRAARLNRVAELRDAISLDEISHEVPDELQLLIMLRQTLLHNIEILIDAGVSAFDKDLARRDGLRGRWIIFRTPIGTLQGTMLGIDALGRLELETDAGTLKHFTTGSVLSWTDSVRFP